MGAVDVGASANQGSQRPAGYRRSAGSKRGEARRQELLGRVADDLAVNGLGDFSLRRAARAAGSTHKVLLYHFDGADDLLRQAILQLRERRIGNALAAATRGPAGPPLAARAGAVGGALPGGGAGPPGVAVAPRPADSHPPPPTPPRPEPRQHPMLPPAPAPP